MDDLQLVEVARREVLLDRRRAAVDLDLAVPAASRARASAASGPSVTKWNVVPVSSSGSRGWW